MCVCEVVVVVGGGGVREQSFAAVLRQPPPPPMLFRGSLHVTCLPLFVGFGSSSSWATLGLLPASCENC